MYHDRAVAAVDLVRPFLVRFEGDCAAVAPPDPRRRDKTVAADVSEAAAAGAPEPNGAAGERLRVDQQQGLLKESTHTRLGEPHVPPRWTLRLRWSRRSARS